MATLFGRHAAFRGLTGPNHFFIPAESIPYKFELGCLSHELCAGRLGVRRYLRAAVGVGEEAEVDRALIVRAFVRFAALEDVLTEKLHTFLRGCPGDEDCRGGSFV
jgi:hypothetical protein